MKRRSAADPFYSDWDGLFFSKGEILDDGDLGSILGNVIGGSPANGVSPILGRETITSPMSPPVSKLQAQRNLQKEENAAARRSASAAALGGSRSRGAGAGGSASSNSSSSGGGNNYTKGAGSNNTKQAQPSIDPLEAFWLDGLERQNQAQLTRTRAGALMRRLSSSGTVGAGNSPASSLGRATQQGNNVKDAVSAISKLLVAQKNASQRGEAQTEDAVSRMIEDASNPQPTKIAENESPVSAARRHRIKHQGALKKMTSLLELTGHKLPTGGSGNAADSPPSGELKLTGAPIAKKRVVKKAPAGTKKGAVKGGKKGESGGDDDEESSGVVSAGVAKRLSAASSAPLEQGSPGGGTNGGAAPSAFYTDPESPLSLSRRDSSAKSSAGEDSGHENSDDDLLQDEDFQFFFAPELQEQDEDEELELQGGVSTPGGDDAGAASPATSTPVRERPSPEMQTGGAASQPGLVSPNNGAGVTTATATLASRLSIAAASASPTNSGSNLANAAAAYLNMTSRASQQSLTSFGNVAGVGPRGRVSALLNGQGTEDGLPSTTGPSAPLLEQRVTGKKRELLSALTKVFEKLQFLRCWPAWHRRELGAQSLLLSRIFLSTLQHGPTALPNPEDAREAFDNLEQVRILQQDLLAFGSRAQLPALVSILIKIAESAFQICRALHGASAKLLPPGRVFVTRKESLRIARVLDAEEMDMARRLVPMGKVYQLPEVSELREELAHLSEVQDRCRQRLHMALSHIRDVDIRRTKERETSTPGAFEVLTATQNLLAGIMPEELILLNFGGRPKYSLWKNGFHRMLSDLDHFRQALHKAWTDLELVLECGPAALHPEHFDPLTHEDEKIAQGGEHSKSMTMSDGNKFAPPTGGAAGSSSSQYAPSPIPARTPEAARQLHFRNTITKIIHTSIQSEYFSWLYEHLDIPDHQSLWIKPRGIGKMRSIQQQREDNYNVARGILAGLGVHTARAQFFSPALLVRDDPLLAWLYKYVQNMVMLWESILRTLELRKELADVVESGIVYVWETERKREIERENKTRDEILRFQQEERMLLGYDLSCQQSGQHQGSGTSEDLIIKGAVFISSGDGTSSSNKDFQGAAATSTTGLKRKLSMTTMKGLQAKRENLLALEAQLLGEFDQTGDVMDPELRVRHDELLVAIQGERREVEQVLSTSEAAGAADTGGRVYAVIASDDAGSSSDVVVKAPGAAAKKKIVTKKKIMGKKPTPPAAAPASATPDEEGTSAEPEQSGEDKAKPRTKKGGAKAKQQPTVTDPGTSGEQATGVASNAAQEELHSRNGSMSRSVSPKSGILKGSSFSKKVQKSIEAVLQHQKQNATFLAAMRPGFAFTGVTLPTPVVFPGSNGGSGGTGNKNMMNRPSKIMNKDGSYDLSNYAGGPFIGNNMNSAPRQPPLSRIEFDLIATTSKGQRVGLLDERVLPMRKEGLMIFALAGSNIPGHLPESELNYHSSHDVQAELRKLLMKSHANLLASLEGGGSGETSTLRQGGGGELACVGDQAAGGSTSSAAATSRSSNSTTTTTSRSSQQKQDELQLAHHRHRHRYFVVHKHHAVRVVLEGSRLRLYILTSGANMRQPDTISNYYLDVSELKENAQVAFFHQHAGRSQQWFFDDTDGTLRPFFRAYGNNAQGRLTPAQQFEVDLKNQSRATKRAERNRASYNLRAAMGLEDVVSGLDVGGGDQAQGAYQNFPYNIPDNSSGGDALIASRGAPFNDASKRVSFAQGPGRGGGYNFYGEEPSEDDEEQGKSTSNGGNYDDLGEQQVDHGGANTSTVDYADDGAARQQEIASDNYNNYNIVVDDVDPASSSKDPDLVVDPDSLIFGGGSSSAANKARPPQPLGFQSSGLVGKATSTSYATRSPLASSIGSSSSDEEQGETQTTSVSTSVVKTVVTASSTSANNPFSNTAVNNDSSTPSPFTLNPSSAANTDHSSMRKSLMTSEQTTFADSQNQGSATLLLDPTRKVSSRGREVLAFPANAPAYQAAKVFNPTAGQKDYLFRIDQPRTTAKTEQRRIKTRLSLQGLDLQPAGKSTHFGKSNFAPTPRTSSGVASNSRTPRGTSTTTGTASTTTTSGGTAPTTRSSTTSNPNLRVSSSSTRSSTTNNFVSHPATSRNNVAGGPLPSIVRPFRMEHVARSLRQAFDYKDGGYYNCEHQSHNGPVLVLGMRQGKILLVQKGSPDQLTFDASIMDVTVNGASIFPTKFASSTTNAGEKGGASAGPSGASNNSRKTAPAVGTTRTTLGLGTAGKKGRTTTAATEGETPSTTVDTAPKKVQEQGPVVIPTLEELQCRVLREMAGEVIRGSPEKSGVVANQLRTTQCL
ncbi:unnamed protein product [Amoebophrya sp. A25]|nr:unnamed protein product [Amoebophrya sp. A25]|eukprot:GSA25T00016798001.1